MANRCMLTTSDNPWNPITHWDEWFAFDYKEKHYNTCGYLARYAAIGQGLSDELNARILEKAIDDIVKENVIRYETDGKVCYMKVVA